MLNNGSARPNNVEGGENGEIDGSTGRLFLLNVVSVAELRFLGYGGSLESLILLLFEANFDSTQSHFKRVCLPALNYIIINSLLPSAYLSIA